MKSPNFLLIALCGTFILFLSSCSDKCADVTCLNAGTCDDGNCECLAGYSGTNCEIADLCIVNAISCENGGTCVNGECNCPDGYSGPSCEVVDECLVNNVSCANGGICVDGECQCPTGWYGPTCEISCPNGTFDGTSCVCNDGYEGPDCSTLTRDKVIGNYLGSDDCDMTGTTQPYSTQIQADPSGAADAILIDGLWNTFFIQTIYATIDGSVITIPSQEPDQDGFFIEGTGTYADGTINWTYSVMSGGTTDECTMTANRQ